MAYAVRVAENAGALEVYPEDVFDQARMDPGVIQKQLKEQLKRQVQEVLEGTLEIDADEQIGALRYERGVVGRQDVRNGYRRRELVGSFGPMELRVPRARRQRLRFRAFAKYQRRWKEFDNLILEAHIGGLSCRDAGRRIAGQLGCELSGTTVARLAKSLEERLDRFRSSPIADVYEALILDGMYLRIRQCGPDKRPVIAVLGVRADGGVDLLAVQVCQSENSPEIEGILRHLRTRGLHGRRLKLVTLDGDRGLEAAVRAVYGWVRIQDCVFHRLHRLHQNAKNKRQGRAMMKEASRAFVEPDVRRQRRKLRRFCVRWASKEPRAVARFQDGLERCFENHQLPPALRSKTSTTSLCEGLFKQIRRRTNQVGAFETPRSVERFVFAIILQKSWLSVPSVVPRSPLFSHPSTHYS